MPMGIQMLGRADFCKLVGLEVEQYNALRRRNQVPLVPNLDLPEAIANERGYYPTAALALIIANEFTDRYDMSRDRSARIALYALQLFGHRWKAVAETSAQVAAGKKAYADILFAVIDWPGAPPKKSNPLPKIGVGTLSEIAAQYPNASSIIAVSATQCAALLRQRAARARIDLGDFWDA